MIAYVASTSLGLSFERRRDEWFKELADAVDVSENKCGKSAEEIFANESFVTATFQATRIAISTHQHEKRVLLRNALLNIASGKGPGEDMQHIYLRLVDEFTPSHVRILDFSGVVRRGLQRSPWDASPRVSPIQRF